MVGKKGVVMILIGDVPVVPTGTVIAIDTETTGLEYSESLLGVSLAWVDETDHQEKSCYLVNSGKLGFDFTTENKGEISGDIIDQIFKTCKCVFHNCPFDYRVIFKEFGFDPPQIIHDTMHLARSVDWQDELKLTFLYDKYCSESMPAPEWWSRSKKYRGKQQAMSNIAEYAMFDAIATLRVYNAIVGKIRKEYTWFNTNTYIQDIRFTNLVMRMIKLGVPVDRQWLTEKRMELERNSARLLGEINKFGIANPNSSTQIGKYLENTVDVSIYPLPRTNSGKISTTEETLAVLADRYPVVAKIVEYKQLIKGITSWVDDIKIMSAADGRVHAILNPFGAKSFRMSSSSINMQGIPMKNRDGAFGSKAFGSFFGMFKSDIPGMELWQIDIKQAEFRLATMLSRENNLALSFSHGDDPYINMSMATWNTPDRRQDAKRAALASIYETGSETFAKNNKIPVEEAEFILNSFRSAFPKIKIASKNYEQFAKTYGYVELLTGRRRYFGPFDELYKAFNQRVQGSLAEIMITIMLEIDKLWPGSIVLQIHDSVVMYMPEDEYERNLMIEDLNRIVQSAIPEYISKMVTPEVPFIADVEKWQL
jgi:DNA polymerase I-like protein with 3'-5' exonuclease and polymerase domains